LRAIVLKHIITCYLELFDGENFWGRHASPKGDDIRLFGQFKQFTDDRASHPLCPVRETIFPGCLHSYSFYQDMDSDKKTWQVRFTCQASLTY
jgi:hypothetical protein